MTRIEKVHKLLADIEANKLARLYNSALDDFGVNHPLENYPPYETTTNETEPEEQIPDEA